MPLPVSYKHLDVYKRQEEGETIQVIRKLRDSLTIGVQNERVALGKEIADRIQV